MILIPKNSTVKIRNPITLKFVDEVDLTAVNKIEREYFIKTYLDGDLIEKISKTEKPIKIKEIE